MIDELLVFVGYLLFASRLCFEANIVITSGRNLAVFARSAITPPTVNTGVSIIIIIIMTHPQAEKVG